MLLREEATGRRHTLQTSFGPVEETEETAPLEEQSWQEVGKRNRTVVTRTVSRRSFMVILGSCLTEV